MDFSFNYGGKSITYKDLKDGVIDKNLSVTVKTHKYNEFDAIEWVLWFENSGEKDSKIISDINDCDMILPFDIDRADRRSMYIPKKTDLCVVSMNGMVESDRYWENARECFDEYTFNYDYLYKLPHSTKKFANRGGRSSDKYVPIFDVTQNNKGYIVAIGWTGDWKAEFTECENGVSVKTGLKETNFYLKPNEKVRTSSVLVMEYDENEDKYNKFRKLIKNHFSHTACTKAEKEGLFAVCFFGSTPSKDMVSGLKKLSENGITFDEIWIDAGWYGKCQPNSGSDWDACVGEWDIHEETHPKRFRDVIEEGRKTGTKMMFWIEPERARSDSYAVKEHPDWFLSLPGTTNNILNYGNKDAWNYAYNLISGYIEELELFCLRQDFNVPLTSFFAGGDEPDRRGITEIKHITGMYELWDRLLEKYPHLMIDNCSSGGRRIDIETLKRSIIFFRTDYFCNDNADPEALQVHNGISKYLPYNGCCAKLHDDTYSFRSAYSSSLGVSTTPKGSFDALKKNDYIIRDLTEEYKSIRKYFTKDFYSYGSDYYDTKSWAIWHYHDADTDSGVIVAFRRCESPFDNVTVKLKGLNDAKEYSYYNFDTKEESKGNSSLTIKLAEKRSSVVIEYK